MMSRSQISCVYCVWDEQIFYQSQQQQQQQQQLQQLQQQQLLQQQQQGASATINQSRNSVKFASPVRYSATRNKTVLKLK